MGKSKFSLPKLRHALMLAERELAGCKKPKRQIQAQLKLDKIQKRIGEMEQSMAKSIARSEATLAAKAASSAAKAALEKAGETATATQEQAGGTATDAQVQAPQAATKEEPWAPIWSKIGEKRRQASRERASQEQASQEQASRERASQEQASQEQASQEQASQEQASQEQASQEQASQEQASQEQASQAATEAETGAPSLLQSEKPRGRRLRQKAPRQKEPRQKASKATTFKSGLKPSAQPIPAPMPSQVVRLSPNPLGRYAFFTPSAPLICALKQPVVHEFGPGLARCERILGYTFKSKALLAEALNNPPKNPEYWANYTVFKIRGTPYLLPGNRRIAIYGDSLMRTFLLGKLMEMGPDLGNSQIWNQINTTALSDRFLVRLFEQLGLASCITNLDTNRPRGSTKYMATTLEALAAAAFIDGGDAALEIVMERYGLDALMKEKAVLYNALRHKQLEHDASAPHYAPHIKYPGIKTSF